MVVLVLRIIASLLGMNKLMENHKKRILLADDNRVMSDVIRFNLERAGFAVTVANDGQQAAELYDSEPFDLIITDYEMPGMNGAELCGHVRLHDAEVPIFLISAKGYAIDIPRLTQELSLAQVLFKPFNPRVLVKLAQAALEPAVAAMSDQSRPQFFCIRFPIQERLEIQIGEQSIQVTELSEDGIRILAQDIPGVMDILVGTLRLSSG